MNVSLPYPPSANRYWRTRLGGTPYLSEEAKAYRIQVARICRGMKPLAGDVRVGLDVYRPAKRGDLDNSIKVLLDALKGFAFVDDQQVVDLKAHRYDDKARPRVEVWVQAAT